MRMNEIEKNEEIEMKEKTTFGCGGQRKRRSQSSSAAKRQDTETLLFALCFLLFIYLFILLKP